MLDTNVFSRYLGRKPSLVKEKFAASKPSDLATCTIVEAELRYGAHKSSNPKQHTALIDELLSHLVVLPFDSLAASEYGRVRADLETAGYPIGGNDLLIASVALARGLTVVTHNLGEFSRIPGLTVEDWE